jgi:hypothetical protein
MHAYEVRPRKDHRGVNLISDVLSFGRLWYREPNAIGYAKHLSRLHYAINPSLWCDWQCDRNATNTRELRPDTPQSPVSCRPGVGRRVRSRARTRREPLQIQRLRRNGRDTPNARAAAAVA